jgi:hypothetical protein
MKFLLSMVIVAFVSVKCIFAAVDVAQDKMDCNKIKGTQYYDEMYDSARCK